MLAKTLQWMDDRFGFRKALNPHAANTHRIFRVQSRNWFEFIKRVGIVAVLAAAGKRSELAQILYFVSVFMVTAPIGTWIEQWEFDYKTRKPKYYRPDIDGEIISPVPKSERPAWSYSTSFVVINSALWMGMNMLIQMLVFEIGAVLSIH